MTVIKIVYGPYEAYGTIKHRFQKIRGLYGYCLTDLGYEIEIIEFNLLNRLTIEMCRRNVFSCDIRNLMFNMDCEDDIVCQRAIAAVEEAHQRFDVEKNFPLYSPVTNGKREIEEMQNLKTQDIISDLMYEHPFSWGDVKS